MRPVAVHLTGHLRKGIRKERNDHLLEKKVDLLSELVYRIAKEVYRLLK
jgi:hypothetical protein